MVGPSRLAGGGLLLLLLLALLPLALDGKPAPPPQALPKDPAAASAAERIMRALLPDSKSSRPATDRMVHPEHQAGGGDTRRLQEPAKKGLLISCFDRRIDRISHTSDMGCRHRKDPPRAPPAAPSAAPLAVTWLIRDLRADSKQSRAA
uniref:Natriuretic peptide BF131 n=1 Tax=Bungarus flaviceps flaviceps TaxID=8615 RepID=VNP31_BUNFL|nr:RecName: Full=Natriuretic peptide BF131; Flags: Precursor [Bungarus flaviceps flaviceps]ADF50041.1 natriuretic peptide [Bungarus flaviceps]